MKDNVQRNANYMNKYMKQSSTAILIKKNAAWPMLLSGYSACPCNKVS